MAFTATKNVPLASTTTGSWPRPAWYNQSLWGRPLDTAMLDPIYREQFSDALAVVVSDQERAGLDIVTCGDYFLDADLAGRSWHHYPLQRWRGVVYDELQPEGTRSDLLKYPPGTLLNEIYTSWRWPIVNGKIEHNPRNPLEYAKIYRMTQARTRKPVKFGTVSGQVMALFLDSHTPEYRIEDNKQQMIWDMATAINRELRELVASGCSVIQIEEPTIHFIACYYPDATDTLNFLTEALNHELEGLENAEIWIHTCWGNPMMQRVFDKTSYANALEIYLDRVKCDVLTLEMKDRGLAELELLGGWKGKTRKKLAIGVVSHRTLNAETPEEVASDIRKALQYVNVENLVVTSDCGFGRQGANRLVAFYKSAAAAQGANIVRREHGLPATYVPCADPQLSQDLVPPAFEEVGSSGARESVASERVAPKLHSRSSGFAPASGDTGRHGLSQAPRFSALLRGRH
jgi:5-methyltetrahydropteroyltriglutamate--homocysteine methyltransferase